MNTQRRSVHFDVPPPPPPESPDLCPGRECNSCADENRPANDAQCCSQRCPCPQAKSSSSTKCQAASSSGVNSVANSAIPVASANPTINNPTKPMMATTAATTTTSATPTTTTGNNNNNNTTGVRSPQWVFRCPACQAVFTHFILLSIHTWSHRPFDVKVPPIVKQPLPADFNPRPPRCYVCTLKFANGDALRAHVDACHSTNEGSGGGSEGSGEFECPFCEVRFESSILLINHIEIGSHPWKDGDFYPIYSGVLQNHVRRLHQAELEQLIADFNTLGGGGGGGGGGGDGNGDVETLSSKNCLPIGGGSRSRPVSYPAATLKSARPNTTLTTMMMSAAGASSSPRPRPLQTRQLENEETVAFEPRMKPALRKPATPLKPIVCNYQCAKCNVRFAHGNQLKAHVDLRHRSLVSSLIKPRSLHCCVYCKAKFRTLTALRRHLDCDHFVKTTPARIASLPSSCDPENFTDLLLQRKIALDFENY